MSKIAFVVKPQDRIKMGVQPVKTIKEMIDYEHYDGEYTVIPEFSKQTLETINKVMDDNLIITEIKVYKTKNTSGGNTVIIGGSETWQNTIAR